MIDSGFFEAVLLRSVITPSYARGDSLDGEMQTKPWNDFNEAFHRVKCHLNIQKFTLSLALAVMTFHRLVRGFERYSSNVIKRQNRVVFSKNSPLLVSRFGVLGTKMAGIAPITARKSLMLGI